MQIKNLATIKYKAHRQEYGIIHLFSKNKKLKILVFMRRKK